MWYGIKTCLLTYNEIQLVIKLSATFTIPFDVKQSTVTAYYPHTNSQVKRFNRTIVVLF